MNGQEEDDDGIKPSQYRSDATKQMDISHAHRLASESQRPQDPDSPYQPTSDQITQHRTAERLNPHRRNTVTQEDSETGTDAHAQDDGHEEEHFDTHFSSCMWVVAQSLTRLHKVVVVGKAVFQSSCPQQEAPHHDSQDTSQCE